MKKYILIFVLFIAPFARADDAPVDMSRAMEISSLKREINELETALAECNRKNKNWKTATWIGAAGTVATGTAAIVQGVKLHKLKQENASVDNTETPTDKKDDKK